MKKRYIWRVVAVILCVGIFMTTASPASTGSETLGWIQKLFNLVGTDAESVNYLFRKSVHLSAFGLLAVVLFNCFEKHRYVKAFLFTTIYAGTDEWHQLYVPNRSGTITDVGIDAIGALVALIIVYTIRRFWLK